MNALRRFVREESPNRLLSLIVAVAVILGRLTADATHTLNTTTMWCVFVPAVLLWGIAYHLPAGPGEST